MLFHGDASQVFSTQQKWKQDNNAQSKYTRTLLCETGNILQFYAHIVVKVLLDISNVSFNFFFLRYKNPAEDQSHTSIEKLKET